MTPQPISKAEADNIEKEIDQMIGPDKYASMRMNLAIAKARLAEAQMEERKEFWQVAVDLYSHALDPDAHSIE